MNERRPIGPTGEEETNWRYFEPVLLGAFVGPLYGSVALLLGPLVCRSNKEYYALVLGGMAAVSGVFLMTSAGRYVLDQVRERRRDRNRVNLGEL